VNVQLGTYNLLDGGGDRWRAQASMLSSLELDILCLQEAKYWDADGYERLYAFAAILGLQPLFAPSGSHDCHLVTLYRWPRVRCRQFHPDVAEGKFHHTVSRAEFTADGVDVTVLNTHLAPFDPQVRAIEAGWLTEYAGRSRNVALVGDLNTEGLHDEELTDWSVLPPELHSRHRRMMPDRSYGGSDRDAMAKLIASGFVDPVEALGLPVPRTTGYWSPSEPWSHRSDHILLNQALAPSIKDFTVVDTEETRSLSDHLPCVAALELIA
jgi:exodeoxyribonuclease-3